MLKLIELVDENEVENDNVDVARYRTFKVFKTVKENVLGNGDVEIYRKLLGRVTAVTVPADDNLIYFYADFAFCSTKDRYTKVEGKMIAIEKLKEKIVNNEDVYIIQRDGETSITDSLREIIANEFGDTISWMNGVKLSDVV